MNVFMTLQEDKSKLSILCSPDYCPNCLIVTMQNQN